MGVFGGIITHLLVSRGIITAALRSAPAGCCVPGQRGARPNWNVFGDSTARSAFMTGAASNGWFLLRWMTIAFLLESLMVAYLPAEKVVGAARQQRRRDPACGAGRRAFLPEQLRRDPAGARPDGPRHESRRWRWRS